MASTIIDSRIFGDMFSDARMGQAVEVEHAAELVEEISASVLRHPNALISLARLKTSDEYTYMHSVAVCALMIALDGGRQALSADIKLGAGRRFERPHERRDRRLKLCPARDRPGMRQTVACDDHDQHSVRQHRRAARSDDHAR